jgi:hypothetical protein
MAPHRARTKMAENRKLIEKGLENSHVETVLKEHGYHVYELIIEMVFMVRYPTRRISRVHRIQFSIQGSEWYENLCKNLGVQSVCILTPSVGMVPIKGLSRQQIVESGRVFADMGSRIYKDTLMPTIPKFYMPNYTHDIDTVLRQIIKDVFAVVSGTMRKLDTPSRFAKYLRNDMLFDFIACLNIQFFSNSVYKVRGVIDFKHFAETYLRALSGKRTLSNLMVYLVARVFKPLWILLHHLSPRFQNYVYEIHAKNSRIGNGSLKMNAGHFGAFWNDVFSQYQNAYFSHYTDTDEIIAYIRNPSQIMQGDVPDDKPFLVSMIETIANRFTRVSKSSVKDPYLQMYSDVSPIAYAEYELTGNIPHAEAVLQNILEDVPLLKHHVATVNPPPQSTSMLISTALKTFEKVPVHRLTIRYGLSKNEPGSIMIFPFDTDSGHNVKVEYDPESALMVYKLTNSITMGRVIINPITGAWQMLDQKSGKFVVQSGTLIEIRHKTERYLMEIPSTK